MAVHVSKSTIFLLTHCVHIPDGSATKITQLSFSPGKSKCIFWVKGMSLETFKTHQP